MKHDREKDEDIPADLPDDAVPDLLDEDELDDDEPITPESDFEERDF